MATDKTTASATGASAQADSAKTVYIYDLAPDQLACTEPEAGAGTGAEAEAGAGTEAEAEAGAGTEAEAEGDAGTEAEADAGDEGTAERPAAGSQRTALKWTSGRLSAHSLISSLLVIALAAVSTIMVLLWRHNSDLSADKAQRQALQQNAGKVAATFFNWDYQHMQQSFAAKYALLTSSAANAIKPTEAALTSYFTTNKTASTARLSGIYPGVIRGDDATVLAVVDTRVTTSASIQTNTGATLLINMKRVKHIWLADNITLVSSGRQSYTDPAGKPISPPSTGGLPGAGASPSPSPSPGH
ncbi:MAG: hypothetical protein JWL58_4153 [Streptosporangiaceae bacterium]|nr:hypothetical protein [Streptosporangiaceae bacterium]